MLHIILIIFAYLLGSVNFSILMSIWLKGKDIRQVGSGNAGATNTLRYLGKGPAVAVLFLDLFKGIFGVWISYWFFPDSEWLPMLTGLAAILGHNWPIFFGFRGGKGVATTVGVMGSLALIPVLVTSVVALSVVAFTRYVSLGSLVFVTLLPILIIIQYGWIPELVAALVVLVLGYVRHSKNIVNLVQGKERKLGEKAE